MSRARPRSAAGSPARSARGDRARREGRGAEVVAALWLMAQGWRVLGFRIPSALGEIDLLVRRGRVLAVIEVKRRRSLEEALSAVTSQQRARLRAAARAIISRRTDLADLAVRLDLVALGPGSWPRHIADAWPEDGGGGWA